MTLAAGVASGLAKRDPWMTGWVACRMELFWFSGLGLMLSGLTFKFPEAGLIVLVIAGMELLSARQTEVAIDS